MSACWRRSAVIFGLAAALVADQGRGQFACGADKKPSSKKNVKKKNAEDLPPINLPADLNEVVLTYDPGLGAGQPDRKGEAPMLKIHGDGTVDVTNPPDGRQASGKLNEKEMKELLSFIVHDQDFLTLNSAMIDEEINKAAAANGAFTDTRGIGNTTITVKLADKQNTVSYRAATIHAKKLQKATLLVRYAETEKRLADVASKTLKGKK
jgi:hypothetical protein